MSMFTPFQSRVAVWAEECFGAAIAGDKLERIDRFIEEALEFAQSTGYPADRVRALSGYVYSRPAGEPGQEVGGVMTTLAAACHAHGLDMEAEARREVERITSPEMVEKIRAKQAAKPTGSALPISVSVQGGPPTGAPADMLQAGDRFQHRWGTTYRVIGKGQLQTSEPLADYATVVVYQSEAVDGLIWVRPVSEFTDGRFAALPSAPDRFDYLTDMQARVLWGTEDDEPLPGGRVRVCAGEWVRIPGGYYFDASAGLLHPETAKQETAEAVPVAGEDEDEDEDETPDLSRMWWFLHILNACGKHGTYANDEPGEWVAAFCGDAEPTDTFNLAINLGLAICTHNSMDETSRIWINDAGKAWLAARSASSKGGE